MKKVLIITYYWPPSGGGGVQRWLKFAKYLPSYGFQPVIFTPENPDFVLQDDSLEKDIDPKLEVIKLPIWEPFGLYRKLFGKKNPQSFRQGIVVEKSRSTLAEKLIVWLRGNLLIPDARIFWRRPAVKYLDKYLIRNNIDTIITTGPPHSIHLIGLGLKNKNRSLKWVADFRDPWSDWDLLNKLKVTTLAKKIHTRLENKVLQTANLVVTTTPQLAEVFSNRTDKNNVVCITNGVDFDDYAKIETKPTNDKFIITHMGLLNEMRNPTDLWLVLEELCETKPEFEKRLDIFLCGMISDTIKESLLAMPIIKDKVRFRDYIPHDEVTHFYHSSSVLLLLMNQSNNTDLLIPGKLFEYLYAQKPILALGSQESEVKNILAGTGHGTTITYDNKAALKKYILDVFEGGNKINNSRKVEKYSRKKLTEELGLHLSNLN